MKEKSILLLLPNQLFKFHDIENLDHIYLWEHSKFFTDLQYHKNKLHYHYATMSAYVDEMKKEYTIEIIDKLTEMKLSKSDKLYIYDITDFEIEKQIKAYCKKHKIDLEILDSPMFLLNRADLQEYIDLMTKQKKNPYFNHSFYIWIRNKLDILMVSKNKPVGSTYSFDTENRLPFKKDYKETKLKIYKNKYITSATNKVNTKYKSNPGEITSFVPVTRKESMKHFNSFLSKKLKNFGAYEDAFSNNVLIGYHSCISAMLNIGLLDVKEVVEKTIQYYKKHKTPIQSVEGFLRQIISWREYVRMLYLYEHVKFNKMNFFNHKRKINKNWYDGLTGMVPVDNVINKVNKLSYAHHIERLMIMSNFALLTEIHPKEIYNWFLSFVSIDAYEWVMEPNVYGMGIHSVGKLMMNKPYFSSSNYLYKMNSNLKKDEENSENKGYIKLGKENYKWSEIWDALYYNFINNNKIYLKKIYSTATSVAHLNKKPVSEVNKLIKLAKLYMNIY